MRSLSTVLCTAAFFATSTLGAHAAEPELKANAVAPMLAMATLNGVLTGANGVKLDCSGTTADIHTDGHEYKTVPTTSNGSGGCAFSAKVPASSALITSCAGAVKLGEANERLALVAPTARTFNAGHEKLGTFGKNSLFSTVGSSAKLEPGATANVAITVGAEP